MKVSGIDRLGGPANAEVNAVQIIAHFTSSITTIIAVIQPELAIVIQSPTLDSVIVEDGTGMIIAGTNCFGSMTITEIDPCQIIAHFTRPVTTIIVATLPELAKTVCTPTLDAIIVEDGTGMCQTGTNCLGSMTTTQVHRGQTAAHLISTITTIQ